MEHASLPSPAALAPGQLRRRCDPARFAFATTADLADFDAALGQRRALDAIGFAVGMRREGYNLFAMGPEGSGRHTLVRRRLEAEAVRLAPPSDWCYVFDFAAPAKPRALRFPGGQAAKFQAGMQRLVEDLRAAVPAAFETDAYRSRRRAIEAELTQRGERAINEVGERARHAGLMLIRTPNGFAFGPLDQQGTSVMDPEAFQKLPEAEKKRYEDLVSRFQEELAAVLQEMPTWRREAIARVRTLNREATGTAIGGLIDELEGEYAALPEVLEYLRQAEQDMLDHAEAFAAKDGEPPFGLPLPEAEEEEETPLRRYAVNVLVCHAPATGAPVVYEDNPNHDALVGRIEHVSRMGALVTDFTLIKAGALHRANGGYLVLDAIKLLSQPFAWEALKRALHSREIRTESLGQALGLISTVSLEPAPIPLDVKVVLIGDRWLYYLLHAYDAEFAELFKVAADFEDDLPRTAENDLLYARVIATFARREQLRPLDAGAVARVIDRQAREAGDADKLSASMQALVDLLREADYWAGEAGRPVIGAADVQRALDAQVERLDRARDRLLEQIVDGQHLIDTAGSRVGQVNGLAVLQLGEFAFGEPHRITARVRPGSGGVIDIEREAKLGGPLHSKGVLILSGFLSGRYAARRPLSLSASLVFEQSYGGVEGDSASAAELFALLSALAGVPLRQALAITGSVNQHGDIQPIGGVNEKIEGFFDVCRSRRFASGDGPQGVLIPATNVRNLMLRDDVVEAVTQGKFAVYPIATVDQGLALLTGVDAETIHARVEERLAEYADSARTVPVLRRKPWERKALKR